MDIIKYDVNLFACMCYFLLQCSIDNMCVYNTILHCIRYISIKYTRTTGWDLRVLKESVEGDKKFRRRGSIIMCISTIFNK
jgi:hypothetical protein